MDSDLNRILDDVVLRVQLMNLEGVQYNTEYFPASAKIYVWSNSLWGDGLIRSNTPYKLVPINRCTHPDLFQCFELYGLSVSKAEKVINPYLKFAYDLKKMKASPVREMTVYHATLPGNIDSICRNNFNWRLHGTSRGSKHGQGVSFSPRTTFAQHFCKSTFDKVIIVAEIFMRNCHVGFPHHVLPEPGYDTTQSGNGNVYVKFNDCEFLPTYIVHYT